MLRVSTSTIFRKYYHEQKLYERDLVVYLAGPMEAHSDLGASTRAGYTEYLDKFNIGVIDPLVIEHSLAQERGVPASSIHLYKASEDPTEYRMFKSHMREIIELDIGMVEESDVLLVKYEGEPSAGTIHEVGHAYLNSIPCYLITSLPREKILSWFLACFDGVFPTLEEATEQLILDFALERPND